MASISTPNTGPTANSGQKKTGVTAPAASVSSTDASLPYVASPSIANGNTTAVSSGLNTASQTSNSAIATSTPKSDEILYNVVEGTTGGPLTENDIDGALRSGRITAKEAAALQRQVVRKPAPVADDEEDDDEEDNQQHGFGEGEDALLAAGVAGAAAGSSYGLGLFAKAALAARAAKKAFDKHMDKAREKLDLKPRGKLGEMTEKEAFEAEKLLKHFEKNSGGNAVTKELMQTEKLASEADRVKKAVTGGEEALKGARAAENAVAAAAKVEKAGMTMFRAGRALRVGAAIGGAVAVGTVAAVASVGVGLVVGAVALTAVVGVGAYLGTKYVMQTYGGKSSDDASEKAVALSGQASLATLKDQTVGFAQDLYGFGKDLMADPKAAVSSVVTEGVQDVKAIGEIAGVGYTLAMSDKKTKDAMGQFASSVLTGEKSAEAYTNLVATTQKNDPALYAKLTNFGADGSATKPEEKTQGAAAEVSTATPTRQSLRDLALVTPNEVSLAPTLPPSAAAPAPNLSRRDLRSMTAAVTTTPKPNNKKTNSPVVDTPSVST